MGRSYLLLITLTASLCSLGSLIQTSHSLANSGSVRMTRGTSRNNNAPDSLSSEVIFHSVDGSDSVEGSGQSVDSTATQKLINRAVISKEPERARSEKRSGPGIALTATPVLTLHHSEVHDLGADRANTSITGSTHSGVHMISEEALSHRTAEGQLKPSHISTVNDDFLDGK